MMRTRLTISNFAGVGYPNFCWDEWVSGMLVLGLQGSDSRVTCHFRHPCPAESLLPVVSP